jgi:hypothetical protein
MDQGTWYKVHGKIIKSNKKLQNKSKKGARGMAGTLFCLSAILKKKY